MSQRTNKYLISALIIGLAFHGTAIFFTLEATYDAYIHLFFADHYQNSWFEPWNYKWYTGFTVMSYPPLIQQTIALLSFIGGLHFGLFTVAIMSVILFITGVYRFSLLMTSNRKVAGYAALLAVFSSSFLETLHLFGQLPGIIGLSLLMHTMPEIYLWIRSAKRKHLINSLSLIAVTACSHHVTPIFGMVFFIFPLIGLVVMDASRDKASTIKEVTFLYFLSSLRSHLKRIVVFGFLSLVIIFVSILPYWINTKNNPITQIPIPHGSRDNFFEITSSGLVFFLVPWGILLVIFPYIFYRYFSKRYLFFGISIALLTILGTGQTTPIPKIILGENAFGIMTMDRFTIWATIMALPIFGEFAYRFVEGDLKILMQNKFGAVYHRITGGILAGLLSFMVVFTMSLGYFRPTQPQKIKMTPIINFLNQDQHDHWRYLTLGFGDQMAFLASQTQALTVDGNYHSARRLPELTTRAIERLENSKFKGIEGIGSLQQFLTVPEKYNLKYIFSNDKFYDPILYFCGWQRLPQLENGIMVWEKLNVPPLSSIIPKEDVAPWQKIMWGVIPLLSLIIAFILNIQMIWIRTLKQRRIPIPEYMSLKNKTHNFRKGLLKIMHFWSIALGIVVLYGIYLFYIKNDENHSPENAVIAYYDALDFKEFERAYKLIDPESELTIAEYMLQTSVTDGLLSSYAKLDELKTEVIHNNDTTAKVMVDAKWITPLEHIIRTDFRNLVKRNGNWYLKTKTGDFDLPPDQLYSQSLTQFFNHGRRRITTEQTHHEDILKQPVLEVLSAKLIKKNNNYAIIGELQNVDNIPADVVLKGSLYNDENKELASYNSKYHVKHKLMPKETTSFKINFEGTAWVKSNDSIPTTFNPDEFTPVNLEGRPTKFGLQVSGNVSGADLYKGLILNDLTVNENKIRGNIFNSGLNEATVPQLLITYYDANKSIIWVDHEFLADGIRQQRKQNFTYSMVDNDQIETLNENMTHCFVNGLPNISISNKIVPDRIQEHRYYKLQPIEYSNSCYIKVEINTFIGNPKL